MRAGGLTAVLLIAIAISSATGSAAAEGAATGGADVIDGTPEPVKPGETSSYADVMSASRLGSLIQATVGSCGGWGRRCRNLAGLAA